MVEEFRNLSRDVDVGRKVLTASLFGGMDLSVSSTGVYMHMHHFDGEVMVCD